MVLNEGYIAYSEFKDHKSIIFINSQKHNIKGYIAIHRASSTIPSFGATRYTDYESDKEAVEDVLRLSKLMSYKSAMAELPYGGAKAVLLSIDNTKAAFKEYGNIVASLRGLFVTGADVGITIDNVKQMRRTSQYIVGTNSNPVRFTVEGVKLAFNQCLKTKGLAKKDLCISIQGLGATGSGILEKVSPFAKEIFVSDIDESKLKIATKYKNVTVVSADEIYSKEVDVFMPCALAHAVNHKNVNNLKTKIIVGSANNQLEDQEVGDILHKKGILYAPDYIVNAGGLIAVADEYEHGNHRIKRVQYKLKVITKNVKKVFQKSKLYSRATNRVADAIAESRFNGIV